MGMTLQKFMGYGLKDLRFVDDQLDDPRLNLDSPIFECTAPDLKDYAEWLQANSCCERIGKEQTLFSLDLTYIHDGEEQDQDQGQRYLDDCYTWSGEDYGLREVLLLQPLSGRDWSRRDDSIDYMTETCLGSQSFDTISRIEDLKHGIYPWNGMYMDSRSGEILPSQVMHWVRACNAEEQSSGSEMDLLAKGIGFTDHAEAQAVIAPTVPEEVRDLASFFELFPSPDTWKELRPMIYTFWA